MIETATRDVDAVIGDEQSSRSEEIVSGPDTRIEIDQLSAPKSKSTNWNIADEDREYHLLARLADQTGQTGITVVLLGLILSTQYDSAWWLIPAVLGIVLIRALAGTLFSSVDLLNHRGARASLLQTIKEELVIGFWFLALCYLADWPPSNVEAGLFVLANLVAQSVVTIAVDQLVVRTPGSHLVWPKSKTQTVVIVGTDRTGLELADSILDSSETATRVIGFVDYRRKGLWRYRDIPLLGHPDQLYSLVGDQQVDLLLICLEPGQMPKANRLVALAERMGTPVGVVDSQFEPRLAQPTGNRIGRFGLIRYHSSPTNKGRLVIKSAIDRMLALVGLIMVMPVMIVTAALIKLESRGPVLFKQTRSGLNGRPFEILKFRTMCNDAEKKKESLSEQNEMSGPVFKIASDPRITKVGHYLRKYSIDELPQLINVVKGEMSLVGPRPPLPKEVAGMEPWQRRKLSVRPGVTCTWQVSGRNAIDFEEWMRLDLEYIDNWSLMGDLRLIARTIPTVIKGSGT